MSDQPTNDDLVRCAIAGDISAFGSLYDRTVRLVRAVAADAGPDAADDVTHDTFLRAYRTLKNSATRPASPPGSLALRDSSSSSAGEPAASTLCPN